MSSLHSDIQDLARRLQAEAYSAHRPHPEVTRPSTSDVIDRYLVTNTRWYLEKVVDQINGCYQCTCYDACLVMIRRMLETLIIEAFEHAGIDSKIRNQQSGTFFYLSKLIDSTLTESTWNLGRRAKKALPNLKNIGNQSAHDRRHIATRRDIDSKRGDINAAVRELVGLADLKQK